jgi:adenylate cyclase
MSVYSLRILDRQKEVYSEDHEGELELGRQQPGEPTPFHLMTSGATRRLIIAPTEERTVARRQLLVRIHEEGRLQLTNLSNVSTVSLMGGEPIAPGATAHVSLPVRLGFGSDIEVIFDHSSSYVELNSLAMMTMRPGASIGDLGEFFGEDSLQPKADRGSEELIRALELMMDVFQMAASSADFYTRACKAAVELVGLDSGRILLKDAEKWKVIKEMAAEGAEVEGVSRFVLNQVLKHKKTFWNSGFSAQRPSESLGDVQAVIAAPILDSNGDVTGILYGERSLSFSSSRRQVFEVTQLHALLLELVACAVASGLARLKGEDAARRLRLQFEQFFTPTLAQHLESHPDMLNGRDANVTVLFGDIRGFSRITEKIGAAKTFDWINDVMGTFSESILRHNGVVVDYIGDEVMAMWGAPEDQPNHARLACQAAIDMVESIPILNERWKSVLDEPFDVGIGINSGTVRAGNMGSNRKFKYGPLGTTVNLASRVQGATKYLKSRLIVTGSTADELGQDFLMRRVADVRVVNIDQPVKLYELPCGNVSNANEICHKYEQALVHFEKRDFRESARMLTTLLSSEIDDGPSVMLLSRAVQAMVEGASSHHPVWQLPGK